MIKTDLYSNNEKIYKERFLTYARTYFKEQALPAEFIELILASSFIESNPTYYTYYPLLFSKVFVKDTDDKLSKLGLAGFLYYRSVVAIDDIFDKTDAENKFNQYCIANICQEECVKILSSLFDTESPFWQLWNKRKFEYIKAYKYDKGAIPINNCEHIEEFADCKSAFGKIGLDALHIITGAALENEYKKLLQSHRYFYTAFQIVDDITDLEEDVKNNQFNILKFEIEKELTSSENFSTADLKKQAYLNGKISDLYQRALNYLQKAYELSGEAEEWKYEVQKLYNTVLSHKLNIDGFVRVFYIRQKLSDTYGKAKDLKVSANLALDFIIKEQNEDGSWDDYFNDAGVSNVWTTAFLISSLPAQLTKCNEFTRATEFLLNHHHNNQWGYNSKWIPDGDSTTFGLIAVDQVTNYSMELSNWLTYQHPEGGFSTYNDEERLLASLNTDFIDNTDGWVQPQFCVSAAAFYYLAKKEDRGKHFSLLKDYLTNELESRGCSAYWWTNKLYSLYYMFMGSLIINDEKMQSICLEHLMPYYDEDYLKTEEIFNNYFYLGLLIQLGCKCEVIYEKSYLVLKQLVHEVLKHQLDDGSWPSGYSLRIPHPSVKDPDTEKVLWKKSDRGTNIKVEDYHRLFTTATCLSALFMFGQKGSAR